MSNQWLDPSGFKSQDEFVKAYNEVHGRAKAYAEIMDILDKSESRIETLTTKLTSKKKNYEI